MESAAVEGDDAVEESSGTSGRGGMRRVKVIPLQHPTPSDVPSFGSSVSSLWRKWRSKLESTTSTEWLGIFLPCSVWIRTYKWKKYLRLDLISGITVGVMLIPQVCMDGFLLILFYFFNSLHHLMISLLGFGKTFILSATVDVLCKIGGTSSYLWTL